MFHTSPLASDGLLVIFSISMCCAQSLSCVRLWLLLQGIFLTQGLNPSLLHLLHCRRFFTAEPLGKPYSWYDLILINFTCNDPTPAFQVRSHSEVLRVTTLTYDFLRDTVQHITHCYFTYYQKALKCYQFKKMLPIKL